MTKNTNTEERRARLVAEFGEERAGQVEEFDKHARAYAEELSGYVKSMPWSRTAAARFLGVTRQDVCSLLAAGDLVSRVVRGRIIVSGESLVAYALRIAGEVAREMAASRACLGELRG